MSFKDLQLAYTMLRKKQGALETLFNYYDGEQPLTYMNKRLDEIFKDLNAYFAENWCSVVVDATKDRINLREVQIDDGQGTEMWSEIWERSEIAFESDLTQEDMLVAGEGYMVAWTDSEGNAEAYSNDPRNCHIFYDPAYPRIKRFAAKWWVDDEKKRRVTLYYTDHLEYFVSKKKATDTHEYKRGSFEQAEKNQANPYSEIPVFHYRMRRRRAISDLKNVVPIQNGINKLLTDMMVAAEFGAFNQRYVISNSETQGKLKNAPGIIWDIPAGDGEGQETEVGQFEATPLENYLKAIENMAVAVSTITRTPKHYFFQIGSNLSGEALIAMEAPLNKKSQDRIDRFIPIDKDLVRFLLKIEGREVPTEKIAPIYDRPETIQPRTQAETRQMNVAAGIPLVTVLRDEGKSEKYIKQMQKDQKAEQESKQDSLAQALLRQKRNFDQNSGDGNQDEGGAQ